MNVYLRKDPTYTHKSYCDNIIIYYYNINNIRIRVTVIMIHRTIDTVNCIWIVTIVTLMSLLLYFVNNNFINFILWKWLLESDSQNIRKITSCFYLTLKKCIASGHYCLSCFYILFKGLIQSRNDSGYHFWDTKSLMPKFDFFF